jgi:hypothetical protein
MPQRIVIALGAAALVLGGCNLALNYNALQWDAPDGGARDGGISSIGDGGTVPVKVDVLGSGQVTVFPGDGVAALPLCSPYPCTVRVPAGVESTFEAEAASGWVFSNWTGACSAESTASCTEVIDEPAEVVAHFVEAGNARQLTVKLNGPGPVAGKASVMVTTDTNVIGTCEEATCVYLVPNQKTVALMALTSERAWAFEAWSGCDAAGDICTLLVDNNRSVSVSFKTCSPQCLAGRFCRAAKCCLSTCEADDSCRSLCPDECGKCVDIGDMCDSSGNCVPK